MKMIKCPLCGKEVPEGLYQMHLATDELVIAKMKRDFPGWSEKDGVCEPCLERYRKAA
jgi:hypothetical protein